MIRARRRIVAQVDSVEWRSISVTPSTEAFVAALPEGLASYGECRVKMSVVRAWVEGHDQDRLLGALPAEIQPRLLLSKPVTAWVGEVEATAVYLTVRDEFFGSDDAFLRAAYEKNARLLRSRAYRTLARLFSRRMLLKAGSRVFSRLHRGVEAFGEQRDDALYWLLTYPAHLVPVLIGHCYATAFRVALELGRWHDVAIDVVEHTPTRTEFLVRTTQ